MLLLLQLACYDPEARKARTVEDVDTGASSDDTDAETGAETSGTADTGETASETGDTSTETAETGETGDTGPSAIAIDLVDPSSGSTAGGEAVTLYGGPFDESASVWFGADTATVTAATATTLSVLTPAHSIEEAVVVVVETSTGRGEAVSAFAYVEPCLGVAPSSTTIDMDLQTVNDATITLTGCATGISPAQQYAGYLEFVSWPSSVDGTGSVTVRLYGSSSSGGYGEWTISLGTDQGMLDFVVHAR